MKSEELILRFLALYTDLDSYKKPFVAFLNKFCENYRNPTQEVLKEFEDLFINNLKKVSYLYGEFAFRTFDLNLEIKSNFNAALFDAQMISMAKLKPDFSLIKKINKKEYLKKTAKLINQEKFKLFISSGTSDSNSVKNRNYEFEKLLKTAY